MAENLDNLIKNMTREILDLKTAQKIPPNVKAFYYTFTADFSSGWSDNGIYCYRVNYVSGENDILTSWHVSGTILATTPSNNQQLLYIHGHDARPQIYALSTRRITGVSKINLS